MISFLFLISLGSSAAALVDLAPDDEQLRKYAELCIGPAQRRLVTIEEELERIKTGKNKVKNRALEIRRLNAERAQLEEQPVRVPKLTLPVRSGQFGSLPWAMKGKVVSVDSSSEVLLELLHYEGWPMNVRQPLFVRLRGVATKDLTDGDTIVLPKVVEVLDAELGTRVIRAFDMTRLKPYLP